MLSLSRKIGERLIVEIPPSDTLRVMEIMVVKAAGERVQVSFNLPADVEIAREEIIDPDRLQEFRDVLEMQRYQDHKKHDGKPSTRLGEGND